MKRKAFIALVMAGILFILNGCSHRNSDGVTAPTNFSYADILTEYERLVEYRLSDDFENKWNSGEFFQEGEALRNAFPDEYSEGSSITEKWSNMIVDMTGSFQSPGKEDFGYVLEDINNDGVDELFWVSKDSRILAVFTMRDGRALLLDAFWARYECVITEKKQLFTLSESGAAYTEYILRKLSPDEFLIKEHGFGTNGISTENELIYYEITGDKQVFVNKDRFEILLAEHPFIQGVDWFETRVSFFSNA